MKSDPQNTLNILLGEDDPDDSSLFLQAIDDSNITSCVHVADNGLKLVSRLRNAKDNIPDIIFLDINMPLKNGLECLQTIRSEDTFNKVPIIIYSTSKNNREIEFCYEKGANYYVVKPFTYKAIVSMISDFCNRDWEIEAGSSLKNFVVSYDEVW